MSPKNRSIVTGAISMPDEKSKQTEIFDPADKGNSKLAGDDPNVTLSVPLDLSKSLSEEWLKKRTDEELIELMVMVSNELKSRKSEPTQRIAVDEVPISFSDVKDIPLEKYIRLPSKSRELVTPKSRIWHIVLVSSDPEHKPLPLKIMGDIVIGRKVEGVNPDLDLTLYEPDKYGISRTHAMIRPTSDQLLLNDLGSTNGTQVNGEALSLGRAGRLTDQSVISFGKLHFQVRITHRPGEVNDDVENGNRGQPKEPGEEPKRDK